MDWIIRTISCGFFLSLSFAAAWAQEAGDAIDRLSVPGLQNYAPAIDSVSDGKTAGRISLEAKLTDSGDVVEDGIVWRIFDPEPGPDGKLPLVATAVGGSSAFRLNEGSYLVHAAFGRAGATKRIHVSGQPNHEVLVLDAGGLKLDAVLPNDIEVPPHKLKFSIFSSEEDEFGERALIIKDVPPGRIVRLNAGTYHVVSQFGRVNAVVRADIRVEAGKLTEAVVEHRAAQITLKLVREPGGEAIADTAWSVETASGDVIRESVGAFSTLVLAEGTYRVIAKNRDRIYSREMEIAADLNSARNIDVEVIADTRSESDTE